MAIQFTSASTFDWRARLSAFKRHWHSTVKLSPDDEDSRLMIHIFEPNHSTET
jgi:hypothetical protein